ncbi:heat shock protein DnaJ family protein [Planoprotostelium fungivorum]|uniref:Heat shock protein DnaJ family protein n=1 Tax=Planoprotostelium fungivorum TaxID=1890364 RepID=A0A2P6N071_9EUKA|nr:heat shock protein DnaJ family protein [Planoprotostelium fungivorum]
MDVHKLLCEERKPELEGPFVPNSMMVPDETVAAKITLRKRRYVSPEQKRYLMRVFQVEPYPDAQLRAQLATKFGTTARKIQDEGVHQRTMLKPPEIEFHCAMKNTKEEGPSERELNSLLSYDSSHTIFAEENNRRSIEVTRDWLKHHATSSTRKLSVDSWETFNISSKRLKTSPIVRSFHTTAAVRRPKDFYEVLGVPKTATKADIKKAFFAAAKQYHPDAVKATKASDAEVKAAETKFKEYGEAYAVLSDDEKRKTYDQFGHQAFDPNMGGGGGGQYQQAVNLEDIMRMFTGGGFGGFGGGGNPFSGGFGDFGGEQLDVESAVQLDFMEAVNGCSKTVKYSAMNECSNCKGSGGAPGSKSVKGSGAQTLNGMFQIQCSKCGGAGSKQSVPCPGCAGRGVRSESKSTVVNIPPGVDNGDTIKVRGAGGNIQKQTGSLFVGIRVKEHPNFQRNGLDIHSEVPISVSDAILGGSINVPTLTGETAVQVAAGTQPMAQHRLRGKGVRSKTQAGDHILHFRVVIPKSLSATQRQMMEEFKKDDKITPESTRLFSKFKFW